MWNWGLSHTFERSNNNKFVIGFKLFIKWILQPQNPVFLLYLRYALLQVRQSNLKADLRILYYECLFVWHQTKCAFMNWHLVYDITVNPICVSVNVTMNQIFFAFKKEIKLHVSHLAGLYMLSYISNSHSYTVINLSGSLTVSDCSWKKREGSKVQRWLGGGGWTDYIVWQIKVIFTFLLSLEDRPHVWF